MAYISYVVPVYNLREQELSKCIKSIINQTYSDNEIIIVDDGSSNGIESYCDELSQQYGIKVIHQKNRGLAFARNTGIDAATGEWIVHVDGDDWIDIHLSESLVELSQKAEADIVVWGYVISTGERKRELLLNNKTVFETDYESIKEDVLCSIMGNSTLFSSICLNTSWAKAYRREFLLHAKLRYDICLRRAQDVPYNLFAFDRAKSVKYIDKALNVYRNDNESLSRSYNPQNIEYITTTANAVKRFVEGYSKSPKIERAYNLFIQRCFRMINESTIQNKRNNHSYWENHRLFNTLINQEPYYSAFKSRAIRSGLLWRISDLLYKHQLYGCIFIYNRMLSALYRLKHLNK